MQYKRYWLQVQWPLIPAPSSLVLANDGGQPHDDGGQGTLHVLVGIVGQLLDAGHDLSQDGVDAVLLAEALTEL